MKKMILVGTAGIMVFLVVGSLAMAQASEEKLQTEVSLLKEIIGEQGVAFEKAEEKEKELQGKIGELENVNLRYWRVLILAGLIIVVLAVVSATAIKCEVKREDELEEAEKDNEKLEEINAAIKHERDELQERLNTIK